LLPRPETLAQSWTPSSPCKKRKRSHNSLYKTRKYFKMVRLFSYPALLLILAVDPASVSAFVPPRPVGSSSFVTRPQQQSYVASNTVLSMNLFDRFSRVAKSNINSILKNLEDPEKIMNQALEDMQVSCSGC
jgi:hypothetical protein